MFIVMAFVLGIVSGLRTTTSPAVTSWAARMGLLAVSGTSMAESLPLEGFPLKRTSTANTPESKEVLGAVYLGLSKGT
jgi:hypothetical protein